MGYAKERGKLELLLVKIGSLNDYSEKSMAIMVDGHEKYSHTLRILKNKHPEAFMDLYQNELEKVKAGKKAVKESETDEARNAAFGVYKVNITDAVEKTIKTTTEV
ncbi:MAG: hypothetical protein EOO92_00465 [Pedobacter sp.]|nr:MAG: hypothetical protein EOO92_00465 [Pedobacter sp.]